ncbi:tubulin epsilon and delta complex protein 1 isoform X2 [Hemicordylus capensis]|uniref:tubulin epsilon and delta complex protein 1 isoform X2 n=1 Tax=Hemicordylus capensis TaxID=884348 RepID=UPI002303EB45|nr:tubulin epsilon and delta complex protein 1 isoform X2 [Hemicordylus capensis]
MDQGPSAARLPAAIEALSLSLPGSRISPETFRLAKFDRPQVSVVFWKLLYSLLKQIQGEGWIEPADTGTLVRFVKSVALSHGYRRLEFYQLPSNGSEGSKELLLVFSWLLCRIGLVEQLLTLSRVKPWDETITCMCDTPMRNLQTGRNMASKDQRDIRYLQWLNGRLQFRWRRCHTDQQEQCKLLCKVHSYTTGCQADPTIGHFSVTEADIVRQPDNYKELLQLMESESSRLEAFLKWKPLEPLYWCWMETVLGPEIESVKLHNVCNKNNPLPSADLGCHTVGKIVEDIDRCKKDLVTLRDGLHELITHKKLGCCGKVRARKRALLGEGEFCKAVRKAQEVAELKLSDLKCNSDVCRIGKMHGPYRLVFKAKCLKGSKTGFVKSAPNKTVTEGIITAADVISDLRKQEARLKAELRRQQEEDRQKIHEAAERLGQMLFIPPMKRQEAKDAN